MKLVDDPVAWHVFRGWAKGEVSDDDVIREYGMDFLVSLRNEFEMQGGTTPSGVQEDGACEGGVDMDNLAVAPPPAESHVEGAEATGLWNSEDNVGRGVTELYDSREGVHMTNAMAQVVEQQALVDGGPTRENEMVGGLGAGDCVPDDPVGRRLSNNKEFCDENN